MHLFLFTFDSFIFIEKVVLSGVPLGVLTLGVYTTATICGEDVSDERRPHDKGKIKARINRKDNKKMKGLLKNKRVKVLAVMEAAVSSESFSNPGLLCLFCVCVFACVPTSTASDVRQEYAICVSVTFLPYTRSASVLTNKHVVIVFCCCV